MSSVANILISIATRNQRGGEDDQVMLTEHLDRYQPAFEVELADDDPVAVAFNGMVAASLVKLEVVGGRDKVRARLTSTDGIAPMSVDPVLAVVARSVPYTAIDLTRVAGGPTVRVRVTLGARESA
jgi:hypothetical protein